MGYILVTEDDVYLEHEELSIHLNAMLEVYQLPNAYGSKIQAHFEAHKDELLAEYRKTSEDLPPPLSHGVGMTRVCKLLYDSLDLVTRGEPAESSTIAIRGRRPTSDIIIIPQTHTINDILNS